MASRLYKVGVTRSWTRHVPPCHYTGILVVKPAQLQWSGFSCGKVHFSSAVPVPTLTRNPSSTLEWLLTLEMGNDEHTEMQLKFQDSANPSEFVTTPKVGGTGLNLTAANHAVITQNFWVLNEQYQAFARVVQQGQNRVPHTWLLNTGPSGYDNRASDLHQLSGVAIMRVLHGLMS